MSEGSATAAAGKAGSSSSGSGGSAKARHYRKKPTAAVEDDPEEEAVQDPLIEAKVAEAKEEQKLRRRAQGVSVIGLATGAKILNQADEIKEGWSLDVGGLIPKQIIKDRNRDREYEDDRVTKALDSAFTTEREERNPQQDMMKYVEEQMARAKRGSDDFADKRTEYEKMVESLYEVPEHLRVESKLKQTSVEKGMLSSQILTGIPEVDLGINAKIKNIEATDAARSGSNRKSTDPLSTYNVKESYAKERYALKGRAKVDDAAEEFEKAKRRAFEEGITDSVRVSADSDGSAAKRDKKDAPTDDFAFDRFRRQQQMGRR